MDFFQDTYGLIFAILTFLSVVCIGGAILSYAVGRRKMLAARLEGQSYTFEVDQNAADPLHQVLSAFGKPFSSKSPSEDLHMKMIRAGFHNKNAVALFLGTKMMLLLGVMLLLVPPVLLVDWATSTKAFILMTGASLSFFIPNFILDMWAKKRTTEVRMHLPDMVDLVEICVSAGMGLDMAWIAVSEQIRTVSPLLADEMALTTLEMQLGEDRGVAMRHMADRTGASEFASLVAVLVQTDRFGTSISEALQVFAQSMRELRSARAEEQAEKMAVKMLLPMCLFIFPVVFIVAVGPAGIAIYEMITTH